MADTVQTVVDLLKDNWVPANSNNITPTISPIFEKKRVGGLGGIKTYIGIYSPSPSTEEPIDLGYNHVSRKEHLAIDIRSSESYVHLLNSKDEVKRIIRANRKTTTGFDVVVIKRINNLSDATRNFWRMVLDLELIVYGEAVS